jgi:hypothetical protein
MAAGCWHRLADHEAEKIRGSAIGAAPNAPDIKANAIRMIEAHAPKTMSEEFRRVVAMGGYKTVGEKKAMSVSKSIPWNHGLVKRTLSH